MLKLQSDDPTGEHVHTGFWNNHAYSKIRGATLTLSLRNGGFLIAFLAIYVSLSGKGFWKIVRFLLHSFFSSTTLPDGVYHQRQAILKNAKTAMDAVEDAFFVILAWRQQSRRSLHRIGPVMIAAIIVAAAFAVASMYSISVRRSLACAYCPLSSGIFSSSVTADSLNEVLLVGVGCKNDLSGTMGLESATSLQIQQSRYLDNLNQALMCYQPGYAEHLQKCQTHVKPALLYTMDTNASCPFSNTICRQPTGNLLADTGYLDSLQDIGINTEPRFSFRMKRHCAPLNMKNFSTAYSDPRQPSDKYMRYNYGIMVAPLAQVGAVKGDHHVYEAAVKDSSSNFSREMLYGAALPYRTK
jgi:hypothetical protein